MTQTSLRKRQFVLRNSVVLIALSALLLGFLYYGLFRDHPLYAYIPGFLEHRSIITQWVPFGYEIMWLPSFLHALATLLFVQMLLMGSSSSTYVLGRIVVFCCLIAFELFLGFADKFDVLAIIAAAATAELVSNSLYRERQPLLSLHALKHSTFQRYALLVVVGVSGLLAAGSGFYGLGSGVDDGGGNNSFFTDCARFENGTCVETKQDAAPIYMSYQELRDSVVVEEARSPSSIGRVYLYENYVLLNEKNAGVHIIDNSDPAQPVNLGFISIPGNTDIAMRSNYLFADSYVDLITLDLNDPTNVQLVNRQEDLFPYDQYQNIPYNISFRENGVDSRLGVVVSYELQGN